jgi:hypothetical protein
LAVARIRLNGIPTINDLPVFHEHGERPRIAMILKTNTGDPTPALERVNPTKTRNFECFVGCGILELFLEVLGDNIIVPWIRSGRWHLFAWQGNIAAPWQ